MPPVHKSVKGQKLPATKRKRKEAVAQSSEGGLQASPAQRRQLIRERYGIKLLTAAELNQSAEAERLRTEKTFMTSGGEDLESLSPQLPQYCVRNVDGKRLTRSAEAKRLRTEKIFKASGEYDLESLSPQLPQNEFTCADCGQIFPYNINLQRHINAEHGDDRKKNAKRGDDRKKNAKHGDDRKKNAKHGDDSKLLNRSDIKLQIPRPVKFTCADCGQTFPYNINLQRHIHIKHKDDS